MQLLEEKKQYIKCNILIKFKQLYLLILCFLVSAILSIAFAIVKFNNGVCISLFFTIAILISVLVIFFNIKSYSEKLWESVFGQITYFRTKIEMDNENISIKRDGLEYVTTKPITDIIKIEKFGADVVITFADKTSVVLSQDAETNDFESFLAKEQINAKISFSQKSFVNKIMVLLSICTFIIAFLLSYIFSDALILGVAAWIKEHDCQLIIYKETIVDLDLLLSITSGEKIKVRVPNSKKHNFEHNAVEIVEMYNSGTCIVSLEKSQELSKENRQMILPVEIVFAVIFGIVAIVCFCGYKGVFSNHKG